MCRQTDAQPDGKKPYKCTCEYMHKNMCIFKKTHISIKRYILYEFVHVLFVWIHKFVHLHACWKASQSSMYVYECMRMYICNPMLNGSHVQQSADIKPPPFAVFNKTLRVPHDSHFITFWTGINQNKKKKHKINKQKV